MTLVETLIRNQFDPTQDRYIKVHAGLMKYFNNLDRAVYFQYLVMTSNYFRIKKKEENPWFYLDKKNMNSFLPLKLTEKSKRSRIDKFLEEKGLIQTTIEKQSIHTRKYYKLDFENIENLVEKIELTGCPSEKPGCHSERHTNNNYTNSIIFFNKKNNRSQKKILRVKKSSTFDNFQSGLRYRRKQSVDNTSNDRVDKKTIDEIISHWLSLGPPFASIRNKSLAHKSISNQINLLSSKTSNPSGLVINTLNTGYKYFSNPDFKFTKKSNLTISGFFNAFEKKSSSGDSRSNGYVRLNNILYDKIKSLVKEKKPKFKPSWFNLFLLYSDKELDKILLDGVPYSDLENNEIYSLLYSTVVFNPDDYKSTRELDKIFYRASVLANNLIEQNYEYITPQLFEHVWKEYIDGNYSVKPHHLLSKNFWNNKFGRYLEEDVNAFGGNRRIHI